MNPVSPARGFTLIELAMALVVVGLILGGMVIGGSAVLGNARNATLLAQVKDLATQARDFKTRYGYFPGDLPNAATLITADGGISAGCSYAIAGNVGNGIVDTATEAGCALEHLVKARLLGKAELAPDGRYVIRHPFGSGTLDLWSTAGKENAVRITNLPCTAALQLDGKLDNASATPLAADTVTGLDASNAAINTCTPGGASDPVPTLLIRY